MARALLLLVLALAMPSPSFAGTIVLESQDRRTWASASMYCCDEIFQTCDSLYKSDESTAQGFEDVWFRSWSTIFCGLPDYEVQHVAMANHSSQLSTSRIEAGSYIKGGCKFPVQCGSRFQVSFTVVTACSYRFSATANVYGFESENEVSIGIGLIGEQTRIELDGDYTGQEQSVIQEGVLTPGQYEVFGNAELTGCATGLYDLELSFGPVAVESVAWQAVKALYR